MHSTDSIRAFRILIFTPPIVLITKETLKSLKYVNNMKCLFKMLKQGYLVFVSLLKFCHGNTASNPNKHFA